MLLLRWMTAAWVSGGWVQVGLVGFARPHGVNHFVVDFEDDALGAVFAVLFPVLALDDGEGVHDVDHSVSGGGEVAFEFGKFLGGLVAHRAFSDAAGYPLAVRGSWQVDVEEGGVQLTAKQIVLSRIFKSQFTISYYNATCVSTMAR